MSARIYTCTPTAAHLNRCVESNNYNNNNNKKDKLVLWCTPARNTYT